MIKLKEYNLPSVESTHTHFSKDAFGKMWTTLVNVQVNFTTIRSRHNEEMKKGGEEKGTFYKCLGSPILSSLGGRSDLQARREKSINQAYLIWLKIRTLGDLD